MNNEGNSEAKELLHMLIHDLRQPVGMGMGYCELLRVDTSLTEEEKHNYLEKIAQQLENITQMLNEYQQRLEDSQGKTNE